MRCDRTDIKELLPAYLEAGIPDSDRERIELHLTSCGDCKMELSLLRTMAEEKVPDPGEAFWAALPERIFRDVRRQDQKERGRPRGLSALFGPTFAPRWAWAAAALAVITTVIVVWYALRPAPFEMAGKQFPDTGGVYVDVLASDQVRIAELSSPEVDSLDAWASTELAPLEEEVIDMFLNAPEGAVDERLADMNTQELEHLSSMLDEENEEDQT